MIYPLPSLHHEAIDWASRVTTNGGTATINDIRAVSNWFADITSLRSLILRANFFLGVGLTSVLVPLIRGPVFGGTTYGSTTDANNGPFVSGDYSTTAGLTGNGTSKYLSTGASIMDQATAASAHSMVWGKVLNADASGDRVAIMAHGATFTDITGIVTRASADATTKLGYAGDPVGNRASASATITSGMLLASAVSNTDLRLYHNGSQIGSTMTSARTAGALSALAHFIFAANANGTPGSYTANTLCGYSLGLGMTSAQALTYYTATARLIATLGRA